MFMSPINLSKPLIVKTLDDKKTFLFLLNWEQSC